MPKTKVSICGKLRSFVREFGENIFSTDGVMLFCKLCEVKVTAEKRFSVLQHCNTVKHKNCVTRYSALENRQRLLFETPTSSSQCSP